MDSQPQMEYRYLGNSGLKVSVVSYGNWLTSNKPEFAEATKACVKRAWELGINFFDTAEVYGSGQAEITIGEALRDLKVPREDLVVSTKLFWGPQGGQNRIGLSRKRILEGCAASLKRLQLDYVDVLFCHRPDNNTPVEETCRAMNYLIDQGKIFYWGTSEWSADRIMEAHDVCDKYGLVRPIVEQPQYHLLHRDTMEVKYGNLFERFGMGTTIWSPLAGGILTGKYNNGIPEGSRFDSKDSFMTDIWNKYFSDGKKENTFKALQGLGKMAEELGCSQAQLALAWVLSNRDVSTAIFGATKVEQVEDNIKAVQVYKKLTNEHLDKIDSLIGNKPETEWDFNRSAKLLTRREKQQGKK